MTTLVWPSEAISKTVLDTLTGPGGPFELREEAVLGARMLVFADRAKSIIELLHRAADRMGDQPYVIFPDRTLVELAVRRPRSVEELRGVHGVGPARIERYGERLLAVLNDTNGTEAA